MDDLVAYYLPPATTTTHYSYQQPPLASYAPQLYNQDEVRTLFIAGLPDDVKPREIYNLFRPVTCVALVLLKHRLYSDEMETNLLSYLYYLMFLYLISMDMDVLQPFGFAVFADQPSALAALHALHGMVFDLEKGSTLHIDLAKSNSRSKRSRIDDDKHGSDKRAKGSFSNSRSVSDPGVGSVHVSGLSNTAYNMIGYPPAQSYGNSDIRTENTSARSRNSSAPCPTIFVANLGPACTEQELTQVFSRCRGFLKLKIQSTYGTPVAFVDFSDTACSSEALNHLQGTVLRSSVAGEGMRLEYPLNQQLPSLFDLFVDIDPRKYHAILEPVNPFN
ncbi:uncharacterized protein LOC143619071 [Bidens hawaiensis]|uniref:uncharacterized protein LOC143619071 n=1 Tax=Bidens hawaiensis TaxID=980011 RepID=UPI0040495C7D